MITWGREYWTYYLIAAGSLFAGPEIYALLTNAANTLSDYSRYELGAHFTVSGQVFQHYNVAWSLSLLAYVILSIELVRHIWFLHW